MKAMVQHGYGGPEVLRYQEVATPVPEDGEVLVQVRAAALNPMDYHLMRGFAPMRPMTGLRRPKRDRPGSDLAGVVAAVGSGVTRFRVGDEVFGAARGALAEFVSAAEHRLAAKPAAISFAQAAGIPVAGLTALQGLRDKGQLQPGQRVLVTGAGGGVGSFAVQIAAAFGAEVTAVCGAAKAGLVCSLGATRAIDYAREDFTRDGSRYDVVFDCAGSRSLREVRRVMSTRGIFLPVGVQTTGFLGPIPHLLSLVLSSPLVSQRVRFFIAHVLPDDLAALAAMHERGELTTVIDRVYPLEAAAEALAELKRGHATGKIIVEVSGQAA
jgi:NADPH:quinone reductase-like Zn-dependent oxidoreductase